MQLTVLRHIEWGIVLTALVLLVGCGHDATRVTEQPTASNTPASSGGAMHQNSALEGLPTVKLWLGADELRAEVAASAVEVTTGMMFRKQIGENEAMLFVFGRPHQAAFYMKNTYVPLSCAYIAPDGTILEIHDLVPLDERPVEAKSDEVQYVLETKQGWFARHKVTAGTLVRTEYGSLRDTFFGNRQDPLKLPER